jgi:hypothetical protein
MRLPSNKWRKPQTVRHKHHEQPAILAIFKKAYIINPAI